MVLFQFHYRRCFTHSASYIGDQIPTAFPQSQTIIWCLSQRWLSLIRVQIKFFRRRFTKSLSITRWLTTFIMSGIELSLMREGALMILFTPTKVLWIRFTKVIPKLSSCARNLRKGSSSFRSSAVDFSFMIPTSYNVSNESRKVNIGN